MNAGTFGGICSDVIPNVLCDPQSRTPCVYTCMEKGYKSNLVNTVCAFEDDHMSTSCTCNYFC